MCEKYMPPTKQVYGGVQWLFLLEHHSLGWKGPMK